MSHSFQSVTFTLLQLILWDFVRPTPAAMLPSHPLVLPSFQAHPPWSLPTAPGLEAPVSGLQRCFFVVSSGGSAQSVALVQVCTPCIPAWGMRSPPLSGSFLMSWPVP